MWLRLRAVSRKLVGNLIASLRRLRLDEGMGMVALRSTKISAFNPPTTWWPGER
jgi:hypothetical protein